MMRNKLKFILLILGFFWSPMGEAKSALKSGLKHYAKSEFEEAVKDLKKALKKDPEKEQKVKIHKFMGLSLFALDKKPEATKSFEQCLALNPSCSIEKKDVLDEAVLPFFEEIKKKFEEDKTKTRLTIKSSIDNVEVLIDGVLIGNANTPLEAKPGTRKLTVRAKGYKQRKVKIAVNKNVENIYQFELEKIRKKDDTGKAEEVEVDPDDPESTVTAVPAKPAAPVALVQEPVSFAHFLPFGTGQFYNGDYVLGAAFLATQITAAAIITNETQNIQKAKANQAITLQQAQADPNFSQDDIDAFTAATNTFIKGRQQQINLAIGAIAGTYVFGVVHALVNRPYVLPTAISLQSPAPEALVFQLQPYGQGLQLQLGWNF